MNNKYLNISGVYITKNLLESYDEEMRDEKSKKIWVSKLDGG